MSEKVGKPPEKCRNIASGNMTVFGPFWETVVDHTAPTTESYFDYVFQCFLHFFVHTHTTRMSLIISVVLFEFFH